MNTVAAGAALWLRHTLSLFPLGLFYTYIFGFMAKSWQTASHLFYETLCLFSFGVQCITMLKKMLKLTIFAAFVATISPVTVLAQSPDEQNAIFLENHRFNFDFSLEQHVCIDMEGDDWKCRNGCCDRKQSFGCTCRVEKSIAVADVQVSVISCTTDHVWEQKTAILDGIWLKNEKGLYRIDTPSEFVSKTPLAFVGKLEPFIPAGLTHDTEKEIADPEIEDHRTAIRIHAVGSGWCRMDENSGGDNFVSQICVDNSKGFTHFDASFDGGSSWTVRAEIKP